MSGPKAIEGLLLEFDQDQMILVNSMKKTIIYDANNRRTEEVVSIREMRNGVITSQSNSHSMPNNKITEEVESKWDAALWVVGWKIENIWGSLEIFAETKYGYEKEEDNRILVERWIYSEGTIGIKDSWKKHHIKRNNKALSYYFKGSNVVFTILLRDQSMPLLKIFNLKGRDVITLLQDETLPDGRHRIIWGGLDNNNRAIANGSYIIKLQSKEEIAAKSFYCHDKSCDFFNFLFAPQKTHF